jgi:hypothetical protein
VWTGQNSISQHLRLENSFVGKTKRHLRIERQHLTVPVPNSVGNRPKVLQKPGAKRSPELHMLSLPRLWTRKPAMHIVSEPCQCEFLLPMHRIPVSDVHTLQNCSHPGPNVPPVFFGLPSPRGVRLELGFDCYFA